MIDFDYESLIVSIPDYPEPGVVFKDVLPLLADAEGLHAVIANLADAFKDAGITKVVGSEARGFMYGAPVAYALGAGFVAARKPGKLPREAFSQEYELEYGVNSLEIEVDALEPGDVVLIIDDLVATGGTAAAQVKLCESAGCKVAGLGFMMELEFLHPREMLAKVTDAPVVSLVKVQ